MDPTLPQSETRLRFGNRLNTEQKDAVLLTLRNIVAFLLVVGTVSLIYYKRITDQGVLTIHSITYRSDFVFFAAVGIGLVEWVCWSRWKRVSRLAPIERLVAVSLGLYLFACLVASAHAYFIYVLPFDSKGLANLGKTVLGSLLLLLTMMHLRGNPRLFPWLAAALWFSPLASAGLGILLLASPASYHRMFGNLSLFGTHDLLRYQGLTSNPSQLATSSFVAIAFLWGLALHGLLRRQWICGIAALLGTVGLAFAVFWSSSRGGAIALIFVLVFVTLEMWPKAAKTRFRLVSILIGALLLVAVAWIWLPSGLRNHFEARWVTGNTRIQIWQYFGGLAVTNPIGLGFNYERRFEFPNPYQADINVQNNVMAAWLYGGVLAVWATLLFMWVCLYTARIALRKRGRTNAWPLYIGAVAGFLAMWLSSLATGILFPDYTHAILAAMVLAGVAYVESPANSAGVLDAGAQQRPILEASQSERSLTIPRGFLVAGVTSIVIAIVFQVFWDVRHVLPDVRPVLAGQRQVAAIFRDAILRGAEIKTPRGGTTTGAQVVFYKGGSDLNEYVNDGTGWRDVKPLDRASLALPEGVIVSGWTFPSNAMRSETDWKDGRRTSTWTGTVTLTGRHGVSASVRVTASGTVCAEGGSCMNAERDVRR